MTSAPITSEISMKNDTFILFPKLPIELRLKIWDTAMPEARILKVLWSEDRGFYTDSTAPAVLHVCSESRTVARKILQLRSWRMAKMQSFGRLESHRMLFVSMTKTLTRTEPHPSVPGSITTKTRSASHWELQHIPKPMVPTSQKFSLPSFPKISLVRLQKIAINLLRDHGIES